MILSLLALIILAFGTVLIVFNIAMQQYIDTSAKKAIADTRSFLLHEEYDSQPDMIEEDRWSQHNGGRAPDRMGAEVFVFLWDGESAWGNRGRGTTDQEIGEQIDLDKADDGIVTVTTSSGTYLATASPSAFDATMILYVDITPLENFAAGVNGQLVLIMIIVGAVAVAVAIVLAASVSRPIEQTVAFAKKIGENDFTPSPLSFRDRELSDLLGEMNRTAEKLGAYDSQQKTFFQNVSHELKTPLMTIRCNAEGIIYSVMEPKPAAETIMHESDRLGEMIDDILYISRMDTITESEVLVECDVREILSMCAENQAAAARAKDVAFVYDFSAGPVIARVSEKSLQRAFSNLISNAIRYASSEVDLACHEQDGKVSCIVANDGPPIAPEDLPYIFDRFFKGKDGQSGIGLSIVRSVVEKLNGSVTVVSNDQGTTFHVTFPAVR